MAFDFPSSPQTGQTYTPGAGMPTYMWNGTAWDALPVIASPGTLVELSRQVVTTAVANVNFTGIDATYDEYEIHFYNVTTSANGAFAMRLSQDNGATFISGANYSYSQTYLPYGATGGISNSAGQTQMNFTGMHNSAAGGAVSGLIRFWAPSTAGFYKQFSWKTHFRSATDGVATYDGSGSYVGDTNAFNALRIFNVAGNLTGTFVLYGRAKAAVAPAPGQRTLLRHIDMNGLTLIDLPLGTAYDTFEIEGHLMALSASGAAILRVSIDGGVTFRSGATDYIVAGEDAWMVPGGSAQWANLGMNAGYIPFSAGFGTSGSAGPADFHVKTRRPSVTYGSGVPRHFEFRATSIDGSNNYTSHVGSGMLWGSWPTTGITHVRLTTGNAVAFTAGSYVKLFGGP